MTNKKKVLQLDANNYFIGINWAEESPKEPGVFHIPGGCIDYFEPELQPNERARWNDGSWVIEDKPAEIKDAQETPKVLTYVEKRLSEYPPMSDYLDAVVKGDQEQIDAYVAACRAVKAKYPKRQIVN